MMAFIGWAWRDSFRHESKLRWGAGAAVNINGGVLAAYLRGHRYPPAVSCEESSELRTHLESLRAPFFLSKSRYPSSTYWNWENNSQKSIKRARKVHFQYSMELEASWFGGWLLFIPHWLILLGVVIPWGALLYWRVKRRRKAAVEAPH